MVDGSRTYRRAIAVALPMLLVTILSGCVFGDPEPADEAEPTEPVHIARYVRHNGRATDLWLDTRETFIDSDGRAVEANKLEGRRDHTNYTEAYWLDAQARVLRLDQTCFPTRVTMCDFATASWEHRGVPSPWGLDLLEFLDHNEAFRQRYATVTNTSDGDVLVEIPSLPSPKFIEGLLPFGYRLWYEPGDRLPYRLQYISKPDSVTERVSVADEIPALTGPELVPEVSRTQAPVSPYFNDARRAALDIAVTPMEAFTALREQSGTANDTLAAGGCVQWFALKERDSPPPGPLERRLTHDLHIILTQEGVSRSYSGERHAYGLLKESEWHFSEGPHGFPVPCDEHSHDQSLLEWAQVVDRFAEAPWSGALNFAEFAQDEPYYLASWGVTETYTLRLTPQYALDDLEARGTASFLHGILRLDAERGRLVDLRVHPDDLEPVIAWWADVADEVRAPLMEAQEDA